MGAPADLRSHGEFPDAVPPLGAGRGSALAAFGAEVQKSNDGIGGVEPQCLLHRRIVGGMPVFHMALKPRANAASIMACAAAPAESVCSMTGIFTVLSQCAATTTISRARAPPRTTTKRHGRRRP